LTMRIIFSPIMPSIKVETANITPHPVVGTSAREYDQMLGPLSTSTLESDASTLVHLTRDSCPSDSTSIT
jgi:hypothetical protein